MSFSLRIECEPAYLRVVATGVFSMPGAQDSGERILAACSEHGLNRVLVDVRGLQGTVSTLDDFEWAACLAAAHGRHVARGRAPVRFAILGNRPVKRPTLLGGRDAGDVAADRFGETVMVNRGLDVRTTTDPAEAVDWLGLRPARDEGELPQAVRLEA